MEIQLTIVINIIPSKDNDEEWLTHLKNDEAESMINDKAD